MSDPNTPVYRGPDSIDILDQILLASMGNEFSSKDGIEVQSVDELYNSLTEMDQIESENRNA